MRKILLLLLLFCCLWRCSDNGGEEEITGSIYGVVTLSGSTEPMIAMGVELFYENALLLKTVTYDDGHYEFDNIQSGHYQLRIVAEGYEQVRFNVIVEAGRTARADMQVVKIKTEMTVSTLEVTDVKGEQVSFHGEVKYKDRNRQPIEVGFVYATNQVPVNGGKKVTAKASDSKYSDGYYFFEFEGLANDLEKGTYYVQAYAKNSLGTEFGEIRTFQVSGEPVVTTLAIKNGTESTATLNGLVEYSGDPVYTEKGFVYSNVFPNPTIDDPETKTKKVSVSGTSSEFSANIADLVKDVTYYVRAYITNADGTVYGETVEFLIETELEYYVLSSVSLMVQKVDLSGGAYRNDAIDLCKSSRLGGFSDWRLPTLGELIEIYNSRSIIGNLTGVYWSSEYELRNGGNVVEYYYFKMYNGYSDYTSNPNQSLNVRAVRSIKN